MIEIICLAALGTFSSVLDSSIFAESPRQVIVTQSPTRAVALHSTTGTSPAPGDDQDLLVIFFGGLCGIGICAFVGLVIISIMRLNKDELSGDSDQSQTF